MNIYIIFFNENKSNTIVKWRKLLTQEIYVGKACSCVQFLQPEDNGCLGPGKHGAKSELLAPGGHPHSFVVQGPAKAWVRALWKVSGVEVGLRGCKGCRLLCGCGTGGAVTPLLCCAKTAEHADRPPLWLPKKETQEPPVNLQTTESNVHLLSTHESGATRRQHKLVLWSHSWCLYSCSHSVTS